ncbi:MAG: hypothetical protein ACREME_02810, partial [Gemmatimonadales bacterium]
MIDSRAFAALFARTLDLFRDPTAKEDQKRQFRALVTLLKRDGATLASRDGCVVVNGTALKGGGGPSAALGQRLELHAVGEITIPPDPPLNEMFELLRALAEQPHSEEDNMASRLRATGAQRITVAMQPPASPRPAVAPPPPAPAPFRPPPPPPAAARTVAPSRRERVPEHARPGEIADLAIVPDEPSSGQSLAPHPDVIPVSLEAGAGMAPFSAATAASRPAAVLLAELERKPDGPQASDLLAVLSRQLETAMRANRIAQALDIVVGIVRAEQQVQDATRRRQYSIALKR